MMKRTLMHLTPLIALLLCLILPWSALAESIQECHKVTMTKADTTQENKSVVRLWTADTVLDDVDEELASIAQAYVEEFAPALPKQSNKTNKNSRLDVETRYSRTGLTWMSFLVQARVTYHRDLTAQSITSRTYNMTTGERIMLTDIFAEDSEGWDILAEAVADQITEYFPDEQPDSGILDELCGREALEQADFTLHGMSLVLHYVADAVYPAHHSLIEVTLFYPEIRQYMTEEAQRETDNLAYYQTAALTFDDGPVRVNTTYVMQTLLEHGTRATFFVIGNRIKEYDDMIQHEHDLGNAIGTHNWSHSNAQQLSAGTIRGMRKKCDAAMINAIGIPTRYDRVPYGLYPPMIKAKCGWPLIQWSLDTYDWRGISSNNVLGKVKNQIADGDIILCHDIKDKTAVSAGLIIDYLENNGYMLLTIDELFAKDGVTLENNTVYYRCTDGDTSKKVR